MIKFIKKKIGESKFEIKEKIKQKSSRLFYIFSIFLFILFLVLLTIFILKEKKIVDNSDISKDYTESEINLSCENCQRRLIDGFLSEEGNNPFIVAVVIDNHPDARPAFGLSQAEIVYDIPAEGGINRYLALFNIEDKYDLQVGPVRSARPYFLDIAQEYRSMLIHCGGSPEALARISKDKILTLNEFYNESYFERSKKYSAPHNVIANFNDIKRYLKDRNYVSSDFSSWHFKDKEIINDLDLFSASLDIKIKNGQKQYEVDWEYSFNENIYLRSLAGKKQLDNSGEQIKADNLIFQFVKTEILDSALRLKINLSGGGKAIVCLDGICKDSYWEKDKNDGRTRYFYDNKEEIVFNAGQTWVHFIDENTEVDY